MGRDGVEVWPNGVCPGTPEYVLKFMGTGSWAELIQTEFWLEDQEFVSFEIPWHRSEEHWDAELAELIAADECHSGMLRRAWEKRQQWEKEEEAVWGAVEALARYLAMRIGEERRRAVVEAAAEEAEDAAAAEEGFVGERWQWQGVLSWVGEPVQQTSRALLECTARLHQADLARRQSRPRYGGGGDGRRGTVVGYRAY